MDRSKLFALIAGALLLVLIAGGAGSSLPEAFSVVNGKLYLNYNRVLRYMFQHNLSANIDKANANCPDVSKTPYPK